MKCPICNEEVATIEQAEKWGPEFAHSRCVVAYNHGKADAAPEAPALPANVREALKAARALLRQSRPYVQYGLHLTELGSQSQSDIFKAADLLRGIDAALARIDALGGGE